VKTGVSLQPWNLFGCCGGLHSLQLKTLFDPDWLAKFVIRDLPGTESSKAYTSLLHLEVVFHAFILEFLHIFHTFDG
jgi:hypothetical protein